MGGVASKGYPDPLADAHAGGYAMIASREQTLPFQTKIFLTVFLVALVPVILLNMPEVEVTGANRYRTYRIK